MKDFEVVLVFDLLVDQFKECCFPFLLHFIILSSSTMIFLNVFPYGALDKSLDCSGHQFYLLVTFVHPSLHIFYHLSNLG